MTHTHNFTRRKANSTVETCSCGKFRHTDKNTNPIIEEIKPIERRSNMGKHTKTPWKVDNDISKKAIYSESGWLIAQTNTIHDQKLGADANADFIVKAVNNHDLLVEALREVQNKLVNYDFLQSTNNNQGRVRAVLSLTATALAQVEKG